MYPMLSALDCADLLKATPAQHRRSITGSARNPPLGAWSQNKHLQPTQLPMTTLLWVRQPNTLEPTCDFACLYVCKGRAAAVAGVDRGIYLYGQQPPRVAIAALWGGEQRKGHVSGQGLL